MQDTFENRLKRILRGWSGRTGRRWTCLSESAIAAFVEGNVSTLERKRIESHIEGCSFCREQAAFLVRGRVDVPQEVPELWLSRAKEIASRDVRVTVRSPWRWATASAVCLVLISIVILHTPRQKTQMPGLNAPAGVRGESDGASVPELLAPASGAIVPRQGAEFQWKPVFGARQYQISVLNRSGDLIWQASTRATSAKLPLALRLDAGQRYFVWIHAYLEDGKAVRSSAVAFMAGNLK